MKIAPRLMARGDATVPQGHPKIAQRFSAGYSSPSRLKSRRDGRTHITSDDQLTQSRSINPLSYVRVLKSHAQTAPSARLRQPMPAYSSIFGPPRGGGGYGFIPAALPTVQPGGCLGLRVLPAGRWRLALAKAGATLRASLRTVAHHCQSFPTKKFIKTSAPQCFKTNSKIKGNRVKTGSNRLKNSL